MNDIESNPLRAITAKAKEKWKKNVEQQKRKSKSAKNEPNKKRPIKQTNTNVKNAPPFKKRKFDHQKRRKRWDYDLPLKQQKLRSLIKLSKMPKGMEEDAIRIFFTQFGFVTRYCLKRHRYGRSLAVGYVEFNHPDVAKIVVDAMDCTSLYGEMLICTEIAPEDVRGSEFFKTYSIEASRLNKTHEFRKRRWRNAATIANLEFQFDAWHKKLIKDQRIINTNLRKHGIQYQFHGFQEEIERQRNKSERDGAVANMKHDTDTDTDTKDVTEEVEDVASFLSDDDSDV